MGKRLSKPKMKYKWHDRISQKCAEEYMPKIVAETFGLLKLKPTKSISKKKWDNNVLIPRAVY